MNADFWENAYETEAHILILEGSLCPPSTLMRTGTLAVALTVLTRNYTNKKQRTNESLLSNLIYVSYFRHRRLKHGSTAIKGLGLHNASQPFLTRLNCSLLMPQNARPQCPNYQRCQVMEICLRCFTYTYSMTLVKPLLTGGDGIHIMYGATSLVKMHRARPAHVIMCCKLRIGWKPLLSEIELW